MFRPKSRLKKWQGFFANGYLTVLTLSGLLDGIAFSFTPKPDCRAISFLAFLDGIIAIVDRFPTITTKLDNSGEGAIVEQQRTAVVHNEASTPKILPQELVDRVGESASPLRRNYDDTINSESRFCRYRSVVLRVSNRILMVIHAALVVLSVAGAIELALAYRYTNPYVFPSATLYRV
jgi:hypothetical protein